MLIKLWCVQSTGNWVGKRVASAKGRQTEKDDLHKLHHNSAKAAALVPGFGVRSLRGVCCCVRPHTSLHTSTFVYMSVYSCICAPCLCHSPCVCVSSRWSQSSSPLTLISVTCLLRSQTRMHTHTHTQWWA